MRAKLALERRVESHDRSGARRPSRASQREQAKNAAEPPAALAGVTVPEAGGDPLAGPKPRELRADAVDSA